MQTQQSEIAGPQGNGGGERRGGSREATDLALSKTDGGVTTGHTHLTEALQSRWI